MKRCFLLMSLIGILIQSCSGNPYVPRIRDVSEERLEGDYWHQRFTLYNPANPGSDCPIDRRGQKINLNSTQEVADAWRVYCRTSSEPDSRSDMN